MGAAAEADGVDVSESTEHFELTVPMSRLVMSIPKQGLAQKKNQGTDAAASERYFYFEDAGRHLILSGWFEPQEAFPGLRKFWDHETSVWSRNKLPAPRNVSFRKIGGWEAIVYHMPRPSGSNSHIRAHWLASGTWIDLHLSVDSEASANENTELLTSLLSRIVIRQK
jgi:hypothetical protein